MGCVSVPYCFDDKDSELWYQKYAKSPISAQSYRNEMAAI